MSDRVTETPHTGSGAALESELDQATARQRLASDPAFSVWVSANAGTGKTRVLIDRISRLLLSGVRPERILCLTYTKAAAAEMENRLSARLGLWATMEDRKLEAEILRLNGSQPQAGTVQRARQLFAETLEAPGGLKIRTIHAFCQSVLGRFPIEAHIAPHASIMDDRVAIALIKEAQMMICQRTLDGQDKALAASVGVMAGLVDGDGFGHLIKEMLNKRQALSRFLREHPGTMGIDLALDIVLKLRPGTSLDTLLADAVQDSAFDRVKLLEAVKVLEKGSKSDRERAQDMAAWLAMSEPERQSAFDDLYKPVFLRKSDDQPRSEKRLITKKLTDVHPGTKAILLVEQQRVFDISNTMKALRVKEGTKHLVIIAAALIKEYENLKRQRALLDYDDLILKTLALLERDGGAGWVHYKLDGGIDHILVDEAQDTSPEQWDVIRHLAAEFFAGEGTRTASATDAAQMPVRSVFAVGDEKQSIYSFQGADPAGFVQMKKFFAELASGQFKSVRLEQSFRSTTAVLNAVDAVFARPEAQEGVAGAEGTHHRAQRSGHAGVVELQPSIQKLPRTDPAPWDAPVDRVRETSPMAQTAESVALSISLWLQNNHMLESCGRPVEAGDIMILVQKRGQFTDEMVRRLKARNIPVAGSDRMVMTEQIAIMDLMAVARFVLLPDDDLNLATVLKGPFINLAEDQLFEAAYGRSGSVWQSLRNLGDEPYQKAAGTLSGWLARADFAPPYEFFATLLGPEGGRRQLLAQLGQEANDPIDEFLNQAMAYEKDQTPSLQGFLAWIDAADTEIKRDMEMARGKVRVMTVHGSKGLEANIVILPDTCSSPDDRTGDNLLWTSGTPLWPGLKDNETGICETLRQELKQNRMEEYRRLLYVAMTRARDRLYVTGWERKSGGKDAKHGRDEDSWYELVRPALKDMDGVKIFDTGSGPIHEFSTPQQNEPDLDDVIHETDDAMQVIPRWMSQPPAPEPAPSVPLSPSRINGEDPAPRQPLEDGDTARFRRGTIIHRLLQTLPDLPPPVRRTAALRWLEQTEPSMDPDQQAVLVDETLGVLENSLFADIFAPGSLAEVPMAGTVHTQDGPKTIAGQADRLVVTDRIVTIVDYKTNRPSPVRVCDVPAKYIHQMALYKSVLEGIYEGREIRCLLVWTDGPHAMMLDQAILSSRAP